jgi:hypothetical protein
MTAGGDLQFRDLQESFCAIPQAHSLVTSGRWIKIAAIRDEEVAEGQVIHDPEAFIVALRRCEARPDIFTFRQELTDPIRRLQYHCESDNLAIIRVDSYEAWFQALSQDTRRNIRRATKKGVVVRRAKFDDAFVSGIKEIYDETPIRQGRTFWHYKKNLEAIRLENGTYPERSEFVGAYHGEELVGYLKLIYVDDAATISQILSKNQHYDKRPANALIANAVAICEEEKKRYLVYCKYTYGNDESSPLAEFKRRNGFCKLVVPRYYVPLTLKGKLAIHFRLHLGLRNILPQPILAPLLKLRLFLHKLRHNRLTRSLQPSSDFKVPERDHIALR